jgi:hypothetical protein
MNGWRDEQDKKGGEATKILNEQRCGCCLERKRKKATTFSAIAAPPNPLPTPKRTSNSGVGSFRYSTFSLALTGAVPCANTAAVPSPASVKERKALPRCCCRDETASLVRAAFRTTASALEEEERVGATKKADAWKGSAASSRRQGFMVWVGGGCVYIKGGVCEGCEFVVAVVLCLIALAAGSS